jgi:phosphoribosylpyrophosphate synthetase
LRRSGAASATVLATHGVFSKSAIKVLESYGDFVKAVVVTNSIPQTRVLESGKLKDKFHVLDVSGTNGINKDT